MGTINYKKVKCPKCGKSYFRVKENYKVDIIPLVFETKPDPIYKDGKLLNSPQCDPIEKYCTCMECGCNFSVSIFGKKYEIIDEDKLHEEREKILADYRKRCEDKRANSEESLVICNPKINAESKLVVETPELESCQLKISQPQFVNLDVKPVFDEFPKTWQDGLKEEIDEIKERLAKLESKVLGENQ